MATLHEFVMNFKKRKKGIFGKKKKSKLKLGGKRFFFTLMY